MLRAVSTVMSMCSNLSIKAKKKIPFMLLPKHTEKLIYVKKIVIMNNCFIKENEGERNQEE